jgi:hypothetical protein
MVQGSLLFVHGTGVRTEGYLQLLENVRSGADRSLPGVEVRGCFWGEAYGARLQGDGVSIPHYAETGGGDEPSEEDRSVALWSVLYTDPLYELRLLRNHPGGGRPVFGQDPPSVVLTRRIKTYEPSDELRTRFAVLGLADELDAALTAIRASDELARAVETAPTDPVEHTQAIARAIVALTLVQAMERGAPALDGQTRDELLETMIDELAGYAMGVGDWLKRPLVGIARRVASRKLVKDRGAITDGTSPAAGDILRFLAHGGEVSDFIVQTVEAAPPPVTLVGHSLGGIMCVSLLARQPLPQVKRLVTVGSQSGFLYEIGALPGLPYGTQLPEHVPAWLNIYDRRDILSYLAAPVFGERAVDVAVDNGQPFPQSHSAYWTNPAVWREIAEFAS